MECGGRSKGFSPASNGSSAKEYRRNRRRDNSGDLDEGERL
jgi:hypothetical protein